MLRVAIILATMVLNFATAVADQVPVPMLLPRDIQAAIDPQVFQGVSGDTAGAIYFPDQILAVKVERVEGDSNQVIKQWSKTHTFYLIPFTISIAPADDRIPEQVNVVSAFSGIGELSRQPIIIDLFPKTGFKPANFSGSGEVRVSSGVQLEPMPLPNVPAVTAKAGLETNAAFKFNYAPAYANIISGFASGNAFWRFTRTQDNYPVGEIPMKLLIALPQTVGSDSVILKFDITAAFSGPWWRTGKVIASFQTVIRVPN